jgi:hypothetical protein
MANSETINTDTALDELASAQHQNNAASMHQERSTHPHGNRKQKPCRFFGTKKGKFFLIDVLNGIVFFNYLVFVNTDCIVKLQTDCSKVVVVVMPAPTFT